MFSELSAGQFYTCGLTVAGVAYCWGYNVYGELGDGTTTTRNVPVGVVGVP
jgi:alpha-tubulin suppressor-like RCC1 family protein